MIKSEFYFFNSVGPMSTGKFLILGAMPLDATPETHIAAGPWCFIGREHIFPDWEHSFEVCSPYTPSAMDAESETAKAIGWGLGLLHGYAAEVNTELPSPLSPYTWECAYGSSVQYISIAMVFAMRQADILIRTYGEEELRVPLLPMEELSLPNTEYFPEWYWHLTGQARFHWLLSRFIEKQKPDRWRLEDDDQAQVPDRFVYPAPFSTYPQKLVAWVLCTLGKGERKSVEGPRGLIKACIAKAALVFWDRLPICNNAFSSRWQQLLLSVVLLFNRRRDVQKSVLLKDKFPSSPAFFPDWCNRIFWTLIPVSLKGIERKIKPQRGFFTKYITNSYHSILPSSTAHFCGLVAGGANIVCIQHSPLYGFFRSTFQQVDDEGRHSGYIAWGDASINKYKNVKLPPLKYVHLFNSHAEQKPLLYYTLDHLAPLANGHYLGYHADIKKYRDGVRQFVGGISSQILKNFKLRPYPFESQGIFHPTIWIEHDLQEVFCANTGRSDHHKMLQSCRISVTDYIASTAIQSLVFNTPLVWILNRRDYENFNIEAQKLADAMYRTNIAHETHESAAKFINGIWNEVPRWWLGDDVQKCRLAVLKRDCDVINIKHPLWQWIKAVATI